MGTKTLAEIKAALVKATLRAGVSPNLITVKQWGAQESWRDVDGYIFVSEDSEIAKRAAFWFMKCARAWGIGNCNSDRGFQTYQGDRGVVVCVNSWSIGD